MVVLFIGTALATLDQDVAYLIFGSQFLVGNIYRAFELALDVFGVVLIVGLVGAVIRRYVVRTPRLQNGVPPTFRWDSAVLLASLLVIAVTGFVVEGLRLAEGSRLAAQDPAQAPWFQAAGWAPVGWLVAQSLSGVPSETLRLWHQVFWWVHGLVALAFVATVPFTKAFHLLSSPLNIFLRNAEPAGRLAVSAPSGVRTIADFTWRQALQIDACTWCGKCQEVCPWFAAGAPLSPRNLVQKLGAALARAARRRNGQLEDLHATAAPAEEVWSCCTCRACEAVCPVYVQHPTLIIDLRRHLVDQGQIAEGLQDALVNLQRYGNSFGQSPRKRADWTKNLGVPIKDARKEPVEWLWFVGDYASYDPRVQPVTQATARVLHLAGVDFGILLDKEQNAGNDVRRTGEEGLFELLREKNSKALQGVNFNHVFTTDPHTFNTLKHEYCSPNNEQEPICPALQGKQVVHYTELFDQLLEDGKLTVRRRLGHVVTFHDPCYLGRYNGVYDAPRRVLDALGVTLVEMPRNRENSFCCGAGGGRIWMKDAPAPSGHQRPAESRIKEALALPGVQYLVVACPKDLAMFQDAVKTAGAEGRLKVVDIAELVWEAVAETPQLVTQQQEIAQT